MQPACVPITADANNFLPASASAPPASSPPPPQATTVNANTTKRMKKIVLRIFTLLIIVKTFSYQVNYITYSLFGKQENAIE
jgi:hypothetical protein